MPSLRFSIAAAATLVASVLAQQTYTIDPSSVLLATRQSWCLSQESSCPFLCTQINGGSMTTAENDCDPEQLTYDCVCDNGLSPNTANYTLTLPYFICTQWVYNCIAACASGDTSCQASCQQNHPCGAQNPTRYNITTTLSTSTATATKAGASNTAGIVYNGPATTTTSSDSSSSSSSAKSAGYSLVSTGRSYGLAVLAGGIFAVFAIFL